MDFELEERTLLSTSIEGDLEDAGDIFNRNKTSDDGFLEEEEDFSNPFSEDGLQGGFDDEDETILYDDLVDKGVSFGLYQKLMVVLAGIVDAGDAIEVMSMSFVLKPATESLGGSDSQKSWLSAVVFGGMLIGGYTWGTMADIWGRRSCLMWALILNVVFGVGAGLCSSMNLLIVFRFLSGIGVGGSMPIVFSYICEILPSSKRGKYLVIVACFWMLGSIMCAGLAWAIIPGNKTVLGYETWRVYLILCALPNVVGIVGLFFAKESPRFELGKGREESCFQILAYMHKFNTGQSLPRQSIILTYSKDGIGGANDSPNNKLLVMFDSTKKIFRPPILSRTIKLMCIWFGLSFGSYGMMMWLPSYFENRFGNSKDGISTYANSFLVAISQLPTNLISIWSVDRFGRRKTLAVSMTLSAIAICFVPILTTQYGVVAMNCVFGSVSMGAWNALNILSTELFPTSMRSTGVGILSVVGRIASITANLIFGQLVEINAAVPIFLVGVFMMFGGIAVMFLPDTRNMVIL